MLFDVRQKLSVASDMMNETVWFGRRNNSNNAWNFNGNNGNLNNNNVNNRNRAQAVAILQTLY